ncbi:MAG: SPOR domain-containing protein [Saprospiraceae bacterium]|nr:SPOR domain-containing protein [Saprospiraceae bacterium]
MSRLDYITISIVGVCIVAIVMLLVKTNDLLNANEVQDKEALQRHLEEMGLEDTADLTSITKPEETDVENTPQDPTSNSEGDEIKYDEKIDEPETKPEPEKEKPAPQKETKPTPPKESKPAPVKQNPPTSKGAFSVLGGSFKQKVNADNLVKQLSGAGFKNATVEISPGGAYARVIVDRFDDKTAADKLAAQLKAKGFESFVQGN